MKQLILSLLFIIPLFVFSQSDTAQVASCCGGKCTGSAYCTACSNCSGCKHCTSGGSCGVCSGGAKWKPAPEPRGTSGTKSTTPKSTTNDPYGTSTDSNKAIGGSVHVVSTTLNMRKGPGVEFDIVIVLNKDAFLTILDPENDGWIHVSHSEMGADKIVKYEGYVSAKHVK